MKLVLFSLLAMNSVSAFAGEVTCFNNNNGDYMLQLRVSEGVVREAAFSNQDWGVAGEGSFQKLELFNGVYRVKESVEPTLAFESDCVLVVSTDRDGKITELDMAKDVAGHYVGFDRYTCASEK